MKHLKPMLFAHSAGKQNGSGEGSYDLVQFLRNALSERYDIRYPIVAEPSSPTYSMYNDLFDAELTESREPIVLIGHSLGGSTLLKYLSEEKPAIVIAGLFLISTPYWGLDGWAVDEFVLKEGFSAGLQYIPEIYLYHSKGDEIVPVTHLNSYKKAFPHAVVRELEGGDHSFENGLPILVSDIKSLL